jgi:hypothetical protein
MKKVMPIFLAGLLFAVTFVGLIQVSKVTGIWINREGREGFEEGFRGGKPAGDFDSDGDEARGQGEGQQNRLGLQENLNSQMKISDYCQMAGIDTDCALAKLGISNDQLELTFSALSQIKGTTTADIISLLGSCQSGKDGDQGGLQGGDDL